MQLQSPVLYPFFRLKVFYKTQFYKNQGASGVTTQLILKQFAHIRDIEKRRVGFTFMKGVNPFVTELREVMSNRKTVGGLQSVGHNLLLDKKTWFGKKWIKVLLL